MYYIYHQLPTSFRAVIFSSVKRLLWLLLLLGKKREFHFAVRYCCEEWWLQAQISVISRVMKFGHVWQSQKTESHWPFFSSSFFFAASSRCLRMIASRARSAWASTVLPSLWSFANLSRASVFSISSLAMNRWSRALIITKDAVRTSHQSENSPGYPLN